jgi:mannose/cellobiose epimerase-like protein (N-acyl-D-glucosamine 2-epimerase family)
MEALTELFDVSRDSEVGKSLSEAVEINRRHFYPLDPARAAFHRHPDWTPATDPRSAGLSYGHNLEFAWLLIRAQQVLGEPPAWSRFSAYLEHALRCGFDHERGGVYYGGIGDQPATQTDKHWWVQCEMLTALTVALEHHPCAVHEQALEQLIDFAWTHLVDSRDGIWLTSVAADGRPLDTRKAHSWKANYHELRASVRFVEAFGGS